MAASRDRMGPHASGRVGLVALLGAGTAFSICDSFALLTPRAQLPCLRPRWLTSLRALRNVQTVWGNEAHTPPPKPHKRKPSQRHVGNDVVFGVVAVELLSTHDRLDEEVGAAFRRAVYQPVLERMRIYASSAAEEESGKAWRLHDNVLERQFSVGTFFTDELNIALNMRQAGEPMLPLARQDCRRVLGLHRAKAGEDPVSSALVAWISHQLSLGSSSLKSRNRRRAFGYAAEKRGGNEWLRPVFVEHDRSYHAERMALVALGDTIKDAGCELQPDAPVTGSVCVYASHTPCISCLACFAQFKRRLPRVQLYFCYDTWSDTRRWIDTRSLDEQHDRLDRE